MLAILSLLFADAGGKVHSNFPLESENARVIQPYDLVKMFFGGRCEPAEVIALQEVYAWMSSHKALSEINDFESAFIFQCRKLNYHIFVDAQLTMRVDSCLRKLANYRLEAECDDDAECFRYWVLDVRCPNEDVRTGDFVEVSFEFASLFWDRYRTYDSTAPLGLGKMVARMEALEPSLMNATIERQAALLWEKRGLYGLDGRRKVTKVMVDDALLREHEVPVFSAYVANRLELRLR